jgi:hypothetical protein
MRRRLLGGASRWARAAAVNAGEIAIVALINAATNGAHGA